MHHAEENNL